MLNLNLYSFSKKENSTKQPTLETAKLVQGILKEPCSIMTPIVRIERLPNDAMPFQYTYAKWVEANRYYFIEDWTWVNGLWEVRMKEDVLATFKTQIGNTTEYVLRTDSTVNFNGDVSDTSYPATTDFVRELSYAPVNPFVTDLTAGCYVVGIISGGTFSGSAHSVGAITYYAMTGSEFDALKEKLFSDDNLITMGLAILDPSTGDLTPTITDISLELLKTMYNPYQYIVSCVWFPFAKTVIPQNQRTDVNNIYIGWWEYPISGSRINAQVVELGGETITLTSHPQSATRGSYLNYAPYTQRTLIGRFGIIPLDTSYLKLTDQIRINYTFDLISGECRCAIDARYDTGSAIAYDTLTVRNFLAGVPIQIAQVGIDYLGTAVSALNTIPQIMGGAISGLASGKGAIMGAIAGGATGIYNTIQSAMPQVETSGSNGSFLSPSLQTCILNHYYKIVDEDIEHRGRPLCAIRQLNTLTGFILCAEGDIDISCYDNERKEIVRYLTEGFFWE